jgi:hypothetical protein
MKTFLSLCLFVFLAAALMLFAAQKGPPQPLYTIDLSEAISHELDIGPTGTLAFLTDSTLAVSICRNLRCTLETFDLGSGKPRMLASRSDEFPHYSSLFRTSDGRLILDGAPSGTEPGAVIFDSQLLTPSLIPTAAGIRQQRLSLTGKTFVQQNKNEWVAYEMKSPSHRLLTGTGRVLCVSDEAVAYFNDGAIHVSGMDGKALGSFGIPPGKALSPLSPAPITLPTIRFLGHDYLWSDNGSYMEILDFNGKAIRTMDRPDGWGFRIGESTDGSRILYDRYTRHIPLTRKIEEEAIAVGTLGMGVGDEEPNGEMVLVIDTKSGKLCFEWSASTNLLVPGQLHADISPSGHLVGIMTPTTLNIYSLPEACGAQ